MARDPCLVPREEKRRRLWWVAEWADFLSFRGARRAEESAAPRMKKSRFLTSFGMTNGVVLFPLVFSLCGFLANHGLQVTLRYGKIFAVSPAPPEDEMTLIRTNRARTPMTVRASPAVFVEVSMSAYSASTSAAAP